MALYGKCNIGHAVIILLFLSAAFYCIHFIFLNNGDTRVRPRLIPLRELQAPKAATPLVKKKQRLVNRLQPYSLDYFHKPRSNLTQNLAQRVKNAKPFTIQVTLKERAIMYDLIRMFDRVLTKHMIPYQMYSGTLLGSFRHHDLIPWDDDLDFWVSNADRARMREVFRREAPRYVLVRAGNHDKIYRSDGIKSNAYTWLWPYVDVSYFKENSTHIWDIASPYGKSTVYPKSITFPYHRRPLYDMFLPAPKDTFAALVWSYGWNSTCKTFGYSHIVEGGNTAAQQTCEPLGQRFGFVEHYPYPMGVHEVLTFKGQNLTDYYVPEPPYAVAQSFQLALKGPLKSGSRVDLPPYP